MLKSTGERSGVFSDGIVEMIVESLITYPLFSEYRMVEKPKLKQKPKCPRCGHTRIHLNHKRRSTHARVTCFYCGKFFAWLEYPDERYQGNSRITPDM